ncbi:hypothetical protein GXW83_14765 [Streptacidiphilus sp. PB12-B1b]|uniref:hypothetical protein n=1 Tax=Streptacidiphilus sp. PB12-B1b TaxID=2705012 RepID=UPI0015F7F849|nr:hypothetical protein [Streptacidiphilus sp. PB12-B1b]QMU76812.1 hypothetical protein GXW83_14765 [Streptacidiphilus sp. PB12-B1b]
MDAGYLTCQDEQVVLSHSSTVLADFVRRIQQLEDDLAVRLGPPSVPLDTAPPPGGTTAARAERPSTADRPGSLRA